MATKELMKTFRELGVEDFRVLLAVEAGMADHEFVPLETIVTYSNLKEDLALRSITNLNLRGLLQRRKGAFTGYRLNYPGYDFLALNAFVKAGRLEAVGGMLGVGKEADIYEALTPEKGRVALKFHRLGRTSFRQTRRARGYTHDKGIWLFQAREAAKREYEALMKLFQHSVSVPQPLAQNRHAVLMGLIEGGELAQCRELPHPIRFLQEIMKNLKAAYLEAGLIHGDLSEFNLILQPDGKLLIIDWPQSVKSNHSEGERLLRRDVGNILRFFKRRFGVTLREAEALRYVTGEEAEEGG